MKVSACSVSYGGNIAVATITVNILLLIECSVCGKVEQTFLTTKETYVGKILLRYSALSSVLKYNVPASGFQISSFIQRDCI